MRRFGLGAAAVVAVFVMMGTATAAASPSPLYSTANGYSCAAGALDTSGPTFGAANIRVHRKGGDPAIFAADATYTVRLRGAQPNTTYDPFFAEQIPGTGCIMRFSLVALTTNDRGNGRVRTTVSVDSTATGRNVLIRGLTDEYATPEF